MDAFIAPYSKRKKSYMLTIHLRTSKHLGKYLLDTVPVHALVMLSGSAPETWVFFLTNSFKTILISSDTLPSRFSAA